MIKKSIFKDGANKNLTHPRNNKAITLIALVITIIVLLLLAGVSITMLSGQDGILTKASDAKSATKNTEDYEGVVLAAQTALVDGLGKVDLADEGALEKALGSKYNYIGEGLVEKDGKYFTVAEDGTVIKGGVKVGDRITYTPPSTEEGKGFNWDDELSGGSNEGKADVLLSNQDTNYAVTSWRVLSIEDGKVNLISENPTTGKVFLGYANGYNNAVKLLNDACDELYGNKAKGITGRSIKIEDIEGLMTEEGLASAHSYVGSVKYGEQYSSPYTDYNYYPAIYANEKLSVINGVKKEAGLGMSEQSTYYTDTENASLKATTSIQPYQTYWHKSAADMKKYLGGETSINYELIMPKQNSTTYWVASRCVDACGDLCSFYVRDVNSGGVGACGMCNSYGDCGGDSLALRPVVSLSSDLLVRAEDGTWSVK